MASVWTPTFTVGTVGASLYVEDGIVEEFPEEGGPRASVTFKVPWEQRYALIAGLRGSISLSGDRIIRTPPFRYPDNTNLICTQTGQVRGVKPRRRDDGWLAYKWAFVPVTFTVPTWQAFGEGDVADPSGQPYVTTKFKLSAEVFTPPLGAYFYAAGTKSGQQVEESSVGVVRSRAEISMTRHRLPYVPLDGIMELDGVVNDEEVVIGDKAFPRGCLLFAGASSDPQPDPATGAMLQDVEFTLLGNCNIEWNEFMDPTGAWVPINDKADGSGDPPFEYVSFAWLFGDTLFTP